MLIFRNAQKNMCELYINQNAQQKQRNISMYLPVRTNVVTYKSPYSVQCVLFHEISLHCWP